MISFEGSAVGSLPSEISWVLLVDEGFYCVDGGENRIAA